MKNMKRYYIIGCLLCAYIFLSLFSYSHAVSSNIASQVLRLHVIANSNTKEDQNLKYMIRDALISYMQTFQNVITTKQEALQFVDAHKQDLEEIAKKIILENGYDYPVTIELGNFSFPTKVYGDISLPAGFYDALKVEIGKANGQNWWCVLFPTLCFVDVSEGIVPEEAKENLELNMQEEDYMVIASDKIEYRVKFKLIEWLEGAKMVMAKK